MSKSTESIIDHLLHETIAKSTNILNYYAIKEVGKKLMCNAVLILIELEGGIYDFLGLVVI